MPRRRDGVALARFFFDELLERVPVGSVGEQRVNDQDRVVDVREVVLDEARAQEVLLLLLLQRSDLLLVRFAHALDLWREKGG
eukprot:1097466-Rhodomonas_salina.2